MILDEIYSRAANTLDMVPAGGAASSPIERANVGEVVGSPKRGGGWAADVVSGAGLTNWSKTTRGVISGTDATGRYAAPG